MTTATFPSRREVGNRVIAPLRRRAVSSLVDGRASRRAPRARRRRRRLPARARSRRNGQHVLAHAFRLALARVAVAAAAAQQVPEQLARLEHDLGDRVELHLAAALVHLERDRRRRGAAALRAARRVVVAVGDVGRRHRIALRAERHPRARRAAPSAGTLRVGPDPHLADSDRVLLLVDLDAVAEHQPVRDRVAVGDPAVVLRACRSALRAEELLVHVRARALAPVVAGDDGEARADAAGAFGEAVAVPGVGDRALRRDHQPLADVRRRDRARMREARDADHAVLAQLHLHAPERAGVVRDVRVDRVEDARSCSCSSRTCATR